MHHLSTSGVVLLSYTFTGTVLVADWERNHLMCTKSWVHFEKMVFKCIQLYKKFVRSCIFAFKTSCWKKAEWVFKGDLQVYSGA